MSLHMAPVEADADLELRVPRGEAGSLDDGARTVLETIDCVRAAEVDRIGGMRPDAFDLYVDVGARLELVPEGEGGIDSDEAAARLRDGFGVIAVERLRLR